MVRHGPVAPESRTWTTAESMAASAGPSLPRAARDTPGTYGRWLPESRWLPSAHLNTLQHLLMPPSSPIFRWFYEQFQGILQLFLDRARSEMLEKEIRQLNKSCIPLVQTLTFGS